MARPEQGGRHATEVGVQRRDVRVAQPRLQEGSEELHGRVHCSGESGSRKTVAASKPVPRYCERNLEGRAERHSEQVRCRSAPGALRAEPAQLIRGLDQSLLAPRLEGC